MASITARTTVSIVLLSLRSYLLPSNRNRVARLVIQSNCRKMIDIHQPEHLDTSTKLKQLHKTPEIKFSVHKCWNQKVMNISKISKPHIQHQENQVYRLILILNLKSNHPQNLWSQQFAPSCHWLTTVRKNRESAIATTHSSKFMITIICTVSSLTKNNAQRHISRNGNALLKNYNHKITLSRH